MLFVNFLRPILRNPKILMQMRRISVRSNGFSTAVKRGRTLVLRQSLTGLFLLGSFLASAVEGSAAGRAGNEDLQRWLNTEKHIAVERLMRNISPKDGARGAVIASPSRSNPDYYFHWVRDAALTMDAVITLYQTAARPSLKSTYLQGLFDYAEFSRSNQVASTLTGLGEPKFYVDGAPFDGPWGRPQNDGPALRAIVLTRFANLLLEQGQTDYVRRALYDSAIPSGSVIKADLEFVSHHWRNASFDLWEEVMGDHFFTRMTQRKALIEGAKLARRLGDIGAADWYLRQAYLIQGEMEKFWRPDAGILIATTHYRGGLDYKTSNLDVAVMLGVMHGYAGDGFLSYSDPRVLSTLDRLNQVFARLYPINQRSESLGVAIGRYPEDLYGGTHFNAGNPWVLATLAAAEVSFRAAEEFENIGKRSSAVRLREQGDAFLARVKYHANPDGSLSEQMDRHSGYMTSAHDLTWNYAAFISALHARGNLK